MRSQAGARRGMFAAPFRFPAAPFPVVRFPAALVCSMFSLPVDRDER